ncbi:hypothetical protein DVS28_a1016 [Euzebya pacifica]|uniref:RNA polymerase sigma-70 region 4 domain-containing protein n=1 Tax=Euzebya pacifica TaxID=1608957 RepID=A0A346XU20_9ACTN|nr:sigma factor-like helix-turn-helix DNA-binding protein [Euzebya pacifica]AXV05717.1 hypothetical protein DVS28_a1016 [Euzebya pacifica]
MNRRSPEGKPDKGSSSSRPRSDSGKSRGGGRNPEEAEALRLRNKLASVLQRLPDIERKVLEARMGLVDGTPMKPGEVADRLGITIHEVKKIETRAFERIREIGPLKGLERFLGK